MYSSDGIETQYLLPPDKIEEITAFKQSLEGITPDDTQIQLGQVAEEILQILTSGGQSEARATLESITFMDSHLFIVLGGNDFFNIDTSAVAFHDPVHVDSMLAEIDLIYKVFDHFKVWMEAN